MTYTTSKYIKRAQQCIAVVEWNWVGHHPMYFANFVVALEELGCDVLAVCPHQDEARKRIEELRQLRGTGQNAMGHIYYRDIVPVTLRHRRLLRGCLGAIDLAIRHFRGIEGTAKEWQIATGKRLDLIFHACVYDGEFQWIHCVQPFLSLPWAGLYLHAMSFRMPGQPNPKTGRLPSPERLFSGSLCKGIAILDEGIAGDVAAVTGKPVVVFPDLTDEHLPAPADGQMLADRMKRWAGGRPIVGLFGYLQPSKGMMPLLLASRHPSLAQVCFAFGGEIHWPLFTAPERQTIDEVLSENHNTWNHFTRIPGEAQLNALLATCDILYAAYLDFPHSSGILTKAALLHKPILVSDGHLMAERVRQFSLGAVVPQGDVEALIAVITRLTKDPAAWMTQNPPRWTDFMRTHSFDRLKQALDELLTLL